MSTDDSKTSEYGSSYLTSEEEEEDTYLGEEEEEEDRQGPWATDGFSRYIGSRFPFFDVTDEEQDAPIVQDQKEMMAMERILQKNTEDLEVLCDNTGLELTQENGQRRLGPPSSSQQRQIPKGCEVFVGKLPKNLNESHIYEVFITVGRIFQIRLMMDFTGTNRGFCFVQYYNPSDASRAIKELNHYQITQRRKIGVTLSVDNCRLFIGGIPKMKNEHEIFEELARSTDNLARVYAQPFKGSETGNRGYAFAEYITHRDAAMARRKMIPGKIQMWGVPVHIDWAEPELRDANRRRDPGTELIRPSRGKYFQKFEPEVEPEIREARRRECGTELIQPSPGKYFQRFEPEYFQPSFEHIYQWMWCCKDVNIY